VGDVRRIGYRYQRTLARTAEVQGVGFITGSHSRLRFLPSAPDSGVVFVRTDLPGRPSFAASAEQVTDTNRRTTIGPNGSGVTLVEHALAALAGLRIDNCTIELDAPEPPGLDGSAAGFVTALVAAGAALQSARRSTLAVTEPIVINHNGATVGLHPPTNGSTGLTASYILDYGPNSPIVRQSYTTELRPETFAREIAGCRTFLLESEARELRNQGIGQHLTPDQLLVFGPRGPLENSLRFADEPARHKVLDLVGDLSLCGFDLVGHVVAYRSGHALNVALAAALTAEAMRPDDVRANPRVGFARRQRAA